MSWGTAASKFANSKAGQTTIEAGIGLAGGWAAGKAQDKQLAQQNGLSQQNLDQNWQIAQLTDARARQQAGLEASQLDPLAQWKSRAKAQLISELMAKGGITHSFDYDSGMGSYTNPFANLSPDTLRMLSQQTRMGSEVADFRNPLAQLSPTSRLADPSTYGYGPGVNVAGGGGYGTPLAQQLAQQVGGAALPKAGAVAPNTDGRGNIIPVRTTQGADGLTYHANGVPVAGQNWKNAPLPKGMQRDDYGRVVKKGRTWWQNAALYGGGALAIAATAGGASPWVAAAIGGGSGAIGNSNNGVKGALVGGALGAAGGYYGASALRGAQATAQASAAMNLATGGISPVSNAGLLTTGGAVSNVLTGQARDYALDQGSSLLAAQLAKRQQAAGAGNIFNTTYTQP